MKIYLAGNFFNERSNGPNWRRGLVTGDLVGEAPYMDDPSDNNRLKWGVLKNAVLSCLDYVGPFADHELEGIAELYMKAIKEADIVFAWVDELLPSEIAKLSAEIAYAASLDKAIGVGTPKENSDTMLNIWFPISMGDGLHGPHVASSPESSLVAWLQMNLPFFPTEKLIAFQDQNPAASKLLGEHMKRSGYVYIIRAETGHYKVGRSKNVPQRMRLFAVKLPFKFDIIRYFPCTDMYLAEKELHEALAGYRTQGEWFNLTQNIVDFLADITAYTSYEPNQSGVFHIIHGVSFETYQDSIEEAAAWRETYLSRKG